MSKEGKVIKLKRSVSKTLRFEVFKRDAFTCQYCGRKAPDVVLQADHIHPHSKGGQDDILNLITSCFDCNAGKRDKELDDQSVLAKQRAQLEELNERRNQLEMMIAWREGLNSLEDGHVELIQAELERASGFTANDRGMRSIRAALRKYEIREILEAIPTSFSQYFDADATTEWKRDKSWAKALDMVPRIIETRRAGGHSEEMKEIFYIRGILRNRFDLNALEQHNALELLKYGAMSGFSLGFMKSAAKTAETYQDFEQYVNDRVDELNNEGLEKDDHGPDTDDQA